MVINKALARFLPERKVAGIREIRSVAEVVSELDAIHNKHITRAVADDFFRRLGAALATLKAEHSTDTTITVFIKEPEHREGEEDKEIEYHATLKPTGNAFSLAVTKAHP